ncbi:hypothetical protein H7849_10930 [Alloacidobacterium dinghuense]|uniref:Uncharacterized protein n=1 Tax=Alloacidobacterium dinghuense TaxID=2763107 RepID=A0A7G8BP86_9BACT|nr:hypothetical protein [Alloacidobacterium dinghuense]QNI34356.1 hypothetical protein H7849_10930 [Alloacidobacterium dinghuense]
MGKQSPKHSRHSDDQYRVPGRRGVRVLGWKEVQSTSGRSTGLQAGEQGSLYRGFSAGDLPEAHP